MMQAHLWMAIFKYVFLGAHSIQWERGLDAESFKYVFLPMVEMYIDVTIQFTKVISW